MRFVDELRTYLSERRRAGSKVKGAGAGDDPSLSASCEVFVLATAEQQSESCLSFDDRGHVLLPTPTLEDLEPLDAVTRSVLSALEQTMSDVRPRVVNANELAGLVRSIWNCQSPFVLVLEAGEWIEPDAIAQAEQLFRTEDRVEVVYSDHDHWSNEPTFPGKGGSRKIRFDRPVLKSAWSPELLRSWNYLGPFVVFRTSLIQRFQPLEDGAYDATIPTALRLSLALQAIEHAKGIAHIAEVLAHRDLESSIVQPDMATLSAHASRSGLQSTPSLLDASTSLRSPNLARQPLVSIVVLTGGATRVVGGVEVLLIENALRSVIDRSTYPKFEIIVVLDSHASAELGTAIRSIDQTRIRVIKDDQPFNFSAANNLGVANAKGEIVIFLNDDTEVVTPDWIERMVMHLVEADVGVVGTQLRFGDGRIQHAGLVLRDGWVEHRLAGRDPEGLEWTEDSLEVGLRRSCDVSAVTGACLAMRLSDFTEVGSFSVEFPLNFNDVDLCLRVRARGQRIVLDQTTVLLHLETSSRSAGITDVEQTLFRERWSNETLLDPFHHPGLTQVRIEHMVPPASLLRLRRLVRDKKLQSELFTRQHETESNPDCCLLPFGSAPIRTVYQTWSNASSS